MNWSRRVKCVAVILGFGVLAWWCVAQWSMDRILLRSLTASREEGRIVFEHYCKGCHVDSPGVWIPRLPESLRSRVDLPDRLTLRRYIAESVLDPDRVIAPGADMTMPRVGLFPWQVSAVVAYLESEVHRKE